MGTKEEGLPVRFVFGYSGQLRPMQVVAGKCEVCKEDVWVDLKKPSKEYRETKAVHHGCEKKEEHRSNANGQLSTTSTQGRKRIL
jgi:hypothetical protein